MKMGSRKISRAGPSECAPPTPDEEPGKDKDLGRRAKSKIRLFDDTTRKGLGGSQAGALSAAGGVTIAGLEEVPGAGPSATRGAGAVDCSPLGRALTLWPRPG